MANSKVFAIYLLFGLLIGFLIIFIFQPGHFNFFLGGLTLMVVIPLICIYIIIERVSSYLKFAKKDRLLYIYSIFCCVLEVILGAVDVIIT